MPTFFAFHNLTYHIKPQNRFISASGSIQAGKALALRGPSGSGKSTTLRMLARLTSPASGEIIFKDQSWHTIPSTIWRTKIHYLAQMPVMFEGSVLDNLRLPFQLAHNKKELRFHLEDAETLLTATGLAVTILEQDARSLSGGEAARVALIRSILVNPTLLLLDEPTAYLDATAKQKVQALLISWLQQPLERAIIIVSHADDDIEAFPDVQTLEM